MVFCRKSGRKTALNFAIEPFANSKCATAILLCTSAKTFLQRNVHWYVVPLQLFEFPFVLLFTVLESAPRQML
jgi:hypothetical protein